MTYNEVGFGLLAVLALLAASAWALRGPDRWLPAWLILAGVGARILGSLIRYQFLFDFYGGAGDARRYYGAGLLRAQEIWSAPTTLLTSDYWSLRTSSWGTGFVEQVSGVVLAIIGDTLRGEFLVFAMFGFVGTYLIVRAYAATHPLRRVVAAATWMWLWPSLWYWPSSVGKEALVLLSFGLTAYGYVGDGRRRKWSSMVAGVLLAYLIRPHVAAVLVLSILVAELVATIRGRLTPIRLIEIILIMLVAAYVAQGAQEHLGLEEIDLEGVSEVTAWYADKTDAGGSSIGEVPSGVTAPLEAFVNVWLRPFPWEAHNFTAGLAALEVLVFLGLMWRQRAYVYRTLWRWHRDPMLRFVAPLLVSYTLMIGLTFANLGIIARQRSPMLGFVFLFFAGAVEPALERRRQAREAKQSRRVRGSPDRGPVRPLPS